LRIFIFGGGIFILSTSSEMKKYRSEHLGWSWFVSLFLFTSYFGIIVYAFSYWALIHLNKLPVEGEEFFRGMKENMFSTLYPIILISQKAMFALILVFFSKSQPEYLSATPEEEAIKANFKILCMASFE
jgi:hypothetical protein